jgi:deoxyadenosine/deoxycytidine kinase
MATSKQPVVIVVDGLIGAGKSEYLKMIRQKMTEKGWSVTEVQEPVERWRQCGMLDRFYQDPKRWGYHFQTKAFHDRIMENIDMFEKYGSQSDVFILERSPFTDTLFMEMLHESKTVDDLEMQHYREWWNMWYRIMPYKLDLFIYLRPDVDVCMDRLKNRARGEEKGVSKEYQVALQKKHDHFFGNGSVQTGEGHYVPCIILNTNENFKDDPDVKEKTAAHFENLIKNIINIRKMHKV